MLWGLHPIGIVYRGHRSQRQLTIGDQADAMGCLPSEISAIERGEKPATDEYISKSAAWLELSEREAQELYQVANLDKDARAQAPQIRNPSQLAFDFERARFDQLQRLRKQLIKSVPSSRSSRDRIQIASSFLECLDLRDKPLIYWLHVIENQLALVDPEYYLHIYPTSGDEVPAYSEANGDVAKRIVLSDHAYLGLWKREPELVFLGNHELAHWLAHPNTHQYSHKQQPAEIEANEIATELLLPRGVVRGFNTAGQLAMTRGVTLKLARARMEELKLGPYCKKRDPPRTRPQVNKRRLPGQNCSASPTCFISYSWEAESHTNWIRRLAEALQENGVYVRWDRWDIRPGTVLPQYIEKSIRESAFVLLICTPTFAARANAGRGGVGYEKAIVSAEIFDAASLGRPNLTKFIPILKDGNIDEAIPSYLRSRTYVDMRDDNLFSMKLQELLRHIYGTPELTRPPLGTRPQFS